MIELLTLAREKVRLREILRGVERERDALREELAALRPRLAAAEGVARAVQADRRKGAGVGLRVCEALEAWERSVKG